MKITALGITLLRRAGRFDIGPPNLRT